MLLDLSMPFSVSPGLQRRLLVQPVKVCSRWGTLAYGARRSGTGDGAI